MRSRSPLFPVMACYIIANFDAASTGQCPDFPQGLRVRVDGERLVADSADFCRTAHVVGMSSFANGP